MTASISNKSAALGPEEIDLGRLIGELVDHRKLIIGITTIFTVIAILYTIFATPIYQADALIQVEQKQNNSILSNISDVLPDSQLESASEIVLLQSRMILGKTVDDQNLQALVQQKYVPIIGRGLSRLFGHHPGEIEVGRIYLAEQQGKMPQLTLTVIDPEHYKIEGGHYQLQGVVGKPLESKGFTLEITKISADPGSSFSIDYIDRLKAITMLQKNFSVADLGTNSGMLKLKLIDANPQLAQQILESISENYLGQNIARQAAQDTKSLQFLETQLPKIRNQLDNAENKLSAYRKQSDSVDLNLQARSALDQIVNVDNQLNQLTFREAEISQLFTKDHPTYIALLEKRQTLEKEKARLNRQVSSMPATQQQVLSLSRDVESGRAVYMQLLNKQQELNISKNSAIGNVRIIDDAVTSPIPVKPNKKLLVLVGLVLGLLLSISIVLLRLFLRRGIESPEELEELGINVYATIPLSNWMVKQKSTKRIGKKKEGNKNLTLLAVTNPTDLSIEAILSLRTSLHFTMMEARNNILMISGASPNAGKTFITTNLAAVLAHNKKRVLLIDGDMRKGYAHELFKYGPEQGMSDILSGNCSIEQTIKKVEDAGFDFISRGTTPQNPSELLMRSGLDNLLDWASANYDIILIDTSPILAATDPAIIGKYAGTTLLVSRFQINTAKEMEVSIKRFEQAGITVKGCILNGVVKKSSSYFSHGYSHYGYSYDNKE